MARLKGKVDTAGTPQAGVTVHAFNTRRWGKPATTVSDANGEWEIRGLYNESHDVVYIHPDPFWEGKVSSRRIPEFDPLDDPHWDKTVCFLDFEGNNQFPTRDSTKYPLYIKKYSSNTDLVAGEGRFGGNCVRFGGAGFTNTGYFGLNSNTYTYNDYNPISLARGDFTIEMWVRPMLNRGTVQFLNWIERNKYTGMILDTMQKFAWRENNQDKVWDTQPLPVNEWSFLVAQRTGNEITIWTNGRRIGSYIKSGDLVDTTSTQIVFGSITNAFPFGGYMDDIRITRFARYDPAEDLLVPPGPMPKGVSSRKLVPGSGVWMFTGQSGTYGIEDRASFFQMYANTSNTPFLVTPSDTADSWVEVDVTHSMNGGVMIRAVPKTKEFGTNTSDDAWIGITSCYRLSFQDSASLEFPNTVRLWKNVNGTYTALTDNIPVIITRDSVTKIRLQADGSNIKAFVGGVEVLSVTDTSIPSGMGGVWIEASGTGAGLCKFNSFEWGTP